MSDSGTRGPKVCSKCGHTGHAEARFCDQCGAPLPTAVVSTSEVPLASEVKYVTVLFADIVGSTEMVADLSPDDARSILEPAVEALAEAVEAFGGTLNRVLG